MIRKNKTLPGEIKNASFDYIMSKPKATILMTGDFFILF
jgi:hypothetical protein